MKTYIATLRPSNSQFLIDYTFWDNDTQIDEESIEVTGAQYKQIENGTCGSDFSNIIKGKHLT